VAARRVITPVFGILSPGLVITFAYRFRRSLEREGMKMVNCPLLATCLFFNDKMAEMPATADLLKERYCRGDNSICARHMVFVKLGREKVPANLMPSDTKRAKDIISSPG
jgi:hypothetical protein